jgi:hypothetical protein
MRLFTIYGVNYAKLIDQIIEEMPAEAETTEKFEQKIKDAQITKPEILGWIDKNSVNKLEMETKKYLKKTYPFTEALSQVAFPEHNMK